MDLSRWVVELLCCGNRRSEEWPLGSPQGCRPTAAARQSARTRTPRASRTAPPPSRPAVRRRAPRAIFATRTSATRAHRGRSPALRVPAAPPEPMLPWGNHTVRTQPRREGPLSGPCRPLAPRARIVRRGGRPKPRLRVATLERSQHAHVHRSRRAQPRDAALDARSRP